jgi:hypothetical protein
MFFSLSFVFYALYPIATHITPLFVVPVRVTYASNPVVVMFAAASPRTEVPGTVVYAVVSTTGASVYATSNFTAFAVGVFETGVMVTFPH